MGDLTREIFWRYNGIVTSSCVEGCSTRESMISARKTLYISQCNFTEGNRSNEPSEATRCCAMSCQL
jgi:hypothetical protein